MKKIAPILARRLNILRAYLLQEDNVTDVSVTSFLESLLQIYGLRKYSLRKKMSVEQHGTCQKITINGRSIYWPVSADISRIIDMYFEIFEKNVHLFDTCGTNVIADDVVIDAGCCEGYFASKALEKGASKVYCFEPGKGVVECLELTFAKEIRNGNIEIIDKLVGDTEQRLLFKEEKADPAVGQILPANGPIGDNCYSVQMTTIDKFVAEKSLTKFDLLKIDVEGSEPEVILGARDAIRRFSPRIAVAAYHDPTHAKELRNLIKGMDKDYKFHVKGLADFDGIVRPVMLHCYKA